MKHFDIPQTKDTRGAQSVSIFLTIRKPNRNDILYFYEIGSLYKHMSVYTHLFLEKLRHNKA